MGLRKQPSLALSSSFLSISSFYFPLFFFKVWKLPTPPPLLSPFYPPSPKYKVIHNFSVHFPTRAPRSPGSLSHLFFIVIYVKNIRIKIISAFIELYWIVTTMFSWDVLKYIKDELTISTGIITSLSYALILNDIYLYLFHHI